MDDPVLEACGLTEPGDDPRQLALTIPRPASGESLRALFSFFFASRDTRQLTGTQALGGRRFQGE